MVSCLEYVSQRKQNLKEQISKFENKPCLAVIQVGDDGASNVYVRNKKKLSEEIGIDFVHVKLPYETDEINLINEINSLNKNKNVHGIITQLPLPEHLDSQWVTNSIAKEKDVDGFRSDSMFNPCTPMGIIDWLKHNKINLSGKIVCVIGRSKIVGKPMVDLLIKENATVIWCHSKTKYLRKHTLFADIVISAIGKPNHFDKNYFKENQIVIDVGINRDHNEKLCGDVYENVSEVVEYKTPVPNGVGKLTVCRLMENVIEAYKLNGGV